ncbi:GntR family transcriptional regulator, partial [Porticoccaceae bacterium]|nr:GntR family transcriptional regulator [Porticoccaceae bacterium]
YLGLIFREDAYRPLKIGERLPGFIKSVRQDGKIDLLISQSTLQGNHDLSQQILEHLADCGGLSALTDKSNPEDIYRQYSVSKKKYKQALGNLYKDKKIEISASAIRLRTSVERGDQR